MDAQVSGGTPDRVQLIISAQSSGPRNGGAKLAGLGREEMQERFTRALDEAAVAVFEMMVGTSLGPAEAATLPRVADYTAMVGLAGDLCGVLSFRCGAPSAGLIAARMLGTEETASADSIRDALGEVCNMVAGAFKTHVTDIIEQCMLSVPMVVSGKDYEMYPLANGVRTQLAKTFEGAPIWMTLDVHGR